MKKLLSIIAMVLACTTAFAQKSLEISFNYQKQAGPGSNQYAIWIENEKGEVIKTLFVTSFTTKGRVRGNEKAARGYTFRPACVPTWVKTANAESMTDLEIDGFTGATPQTNGKQTFTWDFKDKNGKKVASGKYKVCLEATLHNNSIILYSGSFSSKAKKGEIKLTSELIEKEEKYSSMITDVKAVIK